MRKLGLGLCFLILMGLWFPGEQTRVEEDDEGYLFGCRNASNFLDGASIRQVLELQK